MPTVSIVKGRGYAAHNSRTIDRQRARSWDPDKSSMNIVYRDEPIREVYADLFGEALAEYNAGQVEKGHPERQIKDYYEHISRSKQEKPVYELIVQIGDIYDKQGPEYEAIRNALDDYCRGFQQRNPNFHVSQMITHRDEEGMDHVHIQFVPWTSGNRRGLRTKNSLSGAFAAMGFGRQGFAEWRKSELSAVQRSMQKHGVMYEQGTGTHEHLSVPEYRQLQRELDHARSQISASERQLESLDAAIEQKERMIDAGEIRLSRLRGEVSAATSELESVQTVQKMIDNLKPSSRKVRSAPVDLEIPPVKIQRSFMSGDEKVVIEKAEWDAFSVRVNALVKEYNLLKTAYLTLKRQIERFIEPFEQQIKKIQEQREIAQKTHYRPDLSQKLEFLRDLKQPVSSKGHGKQKKKNIRER